MEEQRTRSFTHGGTDVVDVDTTPVSNAPSAPAFTHGGTDVVDVDGVKLHARWRIAGTQEYVAGAGAVVDGARNNIAVTIYFDKLPDENVAVQELLDRIAADLDRPIAVDFGRTKHPMLYCQEIRRDQGDNPIGIALADQPLTELHKKLRFP